MGVPTECNNEGKPPSEWCRAKRVYSLLPAIILVLSILSAMLKPPLAPDGLVLLAILSIASLLAWFVARDIWFLRVRENPLWIDVLCYVVPLGGLAALIFLRESHIYVWNTIYLDVLIVWCSVPIAVVAWLTEKRKGVRIYIGARKLRFDHANVVL